MKDFYQSKMPKEENKYKSKLIIFAQYLSDQTYLCL